MARLLDIIGPIMIGPSSSHTAGAARIAKLASRLLGEPILHADIILYDSFARTYHGHGTELAILGGLLGFEPDDVRLREAKAYASGAYTYTLSIAEGANHPNTARLLLSGCLQSVEVMGISLGGGRVSIVELDGFPVSIDGSTNVVVVYSTDQPGVITNLTSFIADALVNIGNMSVYRREKGASVLMAIEVDQSLSDDLLERISQSSGVQKVVQISPC